jgi:hypothetical protein
VELADLDWGAAGENGLFPRRKRLIRAGNIEHPEAADVLTRAQVGTIRGLHRAVVTAENRFRVACRVKATDEYSHAGSDHLLIEGVNGAVHRWILGGGRVVIVGMVNRYEES